MGEIDMEDWTRQETVEAEEQCRLDAEMEMDLEMERGNSNDSGLSPVIEEDEEQEVDSDDSSDSEEVSEGEGAIDNDDNIDSDSDDHTILVKRLPKKLSKVRREVSMNRTPDVDEDQDSQSSEEEEEYIQKKVRRSKKAVPKVKKEKIKKEKVREQKVKKASTSKGKDKEVKPADLQPIIVGQLFGIKARLTKQLAADQESARLPATALINALPSFNSKTRLDKGKGKEKIKDEFVPVVISESASGFLDSIFEEASTLSTFSAANREPIVPRLVNAHKSSSRVQDHPSPTDSLEDYEDDLLNEPEVDGEPPLRSILGAQPYLESPTKEGAITRWFNTISGENIVPISDKYNFDSMEEDFEILDRYKIKRPFTPFRLPRIFQLKDGHSLILSKPGGEVPTHLKFLSKMGNQLSTLEEVYQDLMSGKNLFKPKFWSSEKRKLWNTVKREAGDDYVMELKEVLKELFCPDSMEDTLDEMLKKIYENNWIWYDQLTVLLQIKNTADRLAKEIDIKQLESLVSEKRIGIVARLALAKRNRYREYENPLEGQEAILYEGKVELELLEVDKDIKIVERIANRV